MYAPPSTSGTPGTSGGTTPLVSGGPAGATSPAIENTALMAARLGYQGRVLGSVDPGTIGVIPMAPTGQYINPSLIANPQSTVNRSISSAATPVISAGGDLAGAVSLVQAAGVVGTTGTGAGLTTSAITASSTVPATNATAVTSNVAASAAPIFVTPSTVATPANTANVLTAGQFAAGAGGGTAVAGNSADVVGTLANPGISNAAILGNANTGTLTPTVSSSLVPTVTAAANPPVTVNNSTIPATNASVSSAAVTTTTTTPAGRVVIPGMTSGTSAATASQTAAATTAVSGRVTLGSALGNTTATSNSAALRDVDEAARAASANVQIPATGMISSSSSAVTAPVTIVNSGSGSRVRAVSHSGTNVSNVVIAPQATSGRVRSVSHAGESTTGNVVVAPATGRNRAVSHNAGSSGLVRIITTSNGTPVITNVRGTGTVSRIPNE